MGLFGAIKEKLKKSLLESPATCPNCGETFTFLAGAQLKNEKGIPDRVLQCPKCGHIYAVTGMMPGRVQLGADVTEKYAATAEKEEPEQ